MSEIITWDNKEAFNLNVPTAAFKLVSDTILKDEHLFTEEALNIPFTILVSLYNVKTAIGKRNLLVSVSFVMNTTEQEGPKLKLDILFVRAFEGWPPAIEDEIKQSKGNAERFVSTPIKEKEQPVKPAPEPEPECGNPCKDISKACPKCVARYQDWLASNSKK